MRKALAFVLFVGSVLAAAQAPATDTKAIEQRLIEMVEDWAKALTTKDLTTLDRLIAADWTSVNPAGIVRTKSELLSGLKAAPKPQESATLTEMKARVLGDTALVTGIAAQKSSVPGEERHGRYRFVDVFVKRNGKWVAVYTQTTKIAE